MKKYLIYLSCVLGLCIILGITSRLSVGFSEWYAVTVYPLIVGTVGRLFGGWFPVSFAEISLIFLIHVPGAMILALVMRLHPNKGKRKAILIETGKSWGIHLSCFISTLLLIFILNCGINYNRELLLNDEKYGFGENYSFTMNSDYYVKEWLVFLTALDEFHSLDLLENIQTDENGVFVLTGDLDVTAPAAIRNLSAYDKRFKTYSPRPKPVLVSGLMTMARILGIYSPFTVEANYNNIIPDSEKPITVLHELAHVAGFMREEEASFIALLAAKESGDIEFMYTAYLDILTSLSGGITKGELDKLPEYYQDLFYQYAGEVDWEETEFFDAYQMLPEQMRTDLSARFSFWWERFNKSNLVIDAISDISAAANDTYLKIQGQEDGVASYGRVTDLVIAYYMTEISVP